MENNRRLGALICSSSGGVFRAESIKKLIILLEKMSYDFLEICMEDLYEISEEPLFGYFRGKYSKEEIKDVISFAKEHHIEIIPSIQTLAHFTHLVKFPAYQNVVDVNDILLIGEKKTYQLIEKMFKSIREYFDTDKINIGFDEAFMVGLGNYLKINGYKNRFDVLLEHLNKVCDIAKKYGFKPHMWSDMFFRSINSGEYCGHNLVIPKDVVNRIPKDIELVYWDYFNKDNSLLNDMLISHEQTNIPTWFALAAIIHNGFAPMNTLSIDIMKNVFEELDNHQVKNVLVTMWGDDGNECSFFMALPSLLAASEFNKGNYDMDVIKNKFKTLFDMSFDDFMLLDIPNKSPKNMDLLKISNPCKSLLYSDAFMGVKDLALQEEGHIPYDEYAKTLRETGDSCIEYKSYFETLSSLCDALSYKAELGIKSRQYYQENNKEELRKLIPLYHQASIKIKTFHELFKKQWLKDNKPFGWEIHEARLGGLESRLFDCASRIEDYLNGKINEIEELEIKLEKTSDWGLQYNNYENLYSFNSR